jgi:hypothetical protein
MMLSNEFRYLSDDKKVEKAVIEIYHILKKDLSVSECNDSQCDNEDCVLFQAVKQYIKYNKIKTK